MNAETAAHTDLTPTGASRAMPATGAATPGEALAGRHVEEYTQGADFAWVAAALMAWRDDILERWLTAVTSQPFHAGRKERAVADHMPHLFDAVVGLLNTTTSAWMDTRAPLEDIGILSAAQSHARARAEQGLKAADVVVEFRLLRQEIWRALRGAIPNSAPTDDVLAAEMLVNDALDGAITQGLAALTDQVEQVREEFLAMTLHDVRQPLTGISGDAQMLARYLRQATPDLARVAAAGERIQASVGRMLEILETLADMSKVALGSLDLRRSPVNLADAVRRALAGCPPDDIARTAVRVSPDADLNGEWDARRLGQVANNLLGNAFKYSPAGTPVEIRLSGDPAAATLCVRDEGIGIPAEDLAHVFARYRRGGNAAAQDSGGSGLGLYLCRGIVEAHGGRIAAESDGIGQGTTITVVLPRQAPGGTAG